MAKTAPSPVLQLIRRIIVDARISACTDRELIQRFLAGPDEAAFQVLLRRHGPMVLDVCRAVLSNEADVEDAFQATFLVLARKARSIRKTGSLASWLHGVAYRTARKAQAQFARRQKHEARVPERTSTETSDELTWREVNQVLHEELNGLPDLLRPPLILCYLRGMRPDEAAAELGLPKGTLKGRLERGRDLLRRRLIRRGLGTGALLVLGAWPAATARAALPAGLVSARALVLATGVMRSMFLAKLRIVTAVLMLGVLGAGVAAGFFTFQTQAVAKVPEAPVRSEVPQPEADPGKKPAAPDPGAPASGAKQSAAKDPDRPPGGDLASRTWAILEVVEQNHIQPPPRREIILKGARALLKQTNASPPEDLARRAATVTSEDQLRAFLRDIWPRAGRVERAAAEKLEKALLDGMFDSIPGRPHVQSEASLKLQAQLRGNRYVGVGVHLVANEKERLPQIAIPFRRGAARKAGSLPGDLLLEIDGKIMQGMTDLEKVVAMLRGAEGTRVTVVVRQPGSAERRTLKLTRALVPLDSLFGFRRDGEDAWDYRIDPAARIAYVWVKSLKSSTLHELAQVERRLHADGMRGLILDFRFSQGDGLLQDAGLVADGLIDGGLMWTARDPHYPVKEWRADRDCLFRDWPMVVLVNGVPDNAQGAVLAALQDRRRATLVGEPTTSDGAIRRAFPLPGEQGMVTVLTGQLERADRSRGWPVRPDREVKLSKEQHSAVENWLTSKQLPVLPPGTDDRPPDDPQLAAGLALLRERLKTAAPPKSQGGK